MNTVLKVVDVGEDQILSELGPLSLRDTSVDMSRMALSEGFGQEDSVERGIGGW